MLAWVLRAKRTRVMTVKLNTMTMPEFLEARFKSRGIKVFTTLVIFIFFNMCPAQVYTVLG